MYVCVCNAVTEHDIRDAAADGVRRFGDLQARTGCSTCCGCCETQAREVLRDAIKAPRFQPQLPTQRAQNGLCAA